MSEKKKLSEMTRAELKRLLHDRLDELHALVADKNRIGAKVSRQSASVAKVKAELKKRDGVEPTVSEHAIVRYLERTGRLSRSEIEAELLTDELMDAMRSGKETYEAPDGMKFKMNPANFVVCTVLAPGMNDPDEM